MNRNKISDDDILKILFQTNWSDSEDSCIESEDVNVKDVHSSENITILTNNVEGKQSLNLQTLWFIFYTVQYFLLVF